MLTARTLATVLEGPRVVTRRWRAAVALHRARGNGHRRRAAVVVRQQAARAMYRARDARRHGLVYGYRSGTAALVCGLESVGGFALALSLALLVSSRHFLVLLDSAVSVVHFAIAVVGRAARLAVVALVAVHVWICSCKEEKKDKEKISRHALIQSISSSPTAIRRRPGGSMRWRRSESRAAVFFDQPTTQAQEDLSRNRKWEKRVDSQLEGHS